MLSIASHGQSLFVPGIAHFPHWRFRLLSGLFDFVIWRHNVQLLILPEKNMRFPVKNINF